MTGRYEPLLDLRPSFIERGSPVRVRKRALQRRRNRGLLRFCCLMVHHGVPPHRFGDTVGLGKLRESCKSATTWLWRSTSYIGREVQSRSRRWAHLVSKLANGCASL